MSVSILGVRIDNVTMEEAISRVEEMVSDGAKHHVVTPNPEFLVDAQRDKVFQKILNEADLAVPDGVGLILAAKLLGSSLSERVSGTDFMERLASIAAEKGWGVFLLGAQEGVAEQASRVLAKRYPTLKVLGSYAGNAQDISDQETRDKIAERIGDERTDLLFVAFGHGRQEKWIARNLPYLNVAAAIGVGGAFDFVSRKVKRAPRWIRRIGLEWLWRLLVEPWRVKRIFKAVVVFPWLVFKDFLSSRRIQDH